MNAMMNSKKETFYEVVPLFFSTHASVQKVIAKFLRIFPKNNWGTVEGCRCKESAKLRNYKKLCGGK